MRIKTLSALSAKLKTRAGIVRQEYDSSLSVLAKEVSQFEAQVAGLLPSRLVSRALRAVANQWSESKSPSLELPGSALSPAQLRYSVEQQALLGQPGLIPASEVFSSAFPVPGSDEQPLGQDRGIATGEQGRSPTKLLPIKLRR
jgi:hypothetical protein